MTRSLYAGAARCTINPLLGTPKAGTRLFGDPIQFVESDLTATALVLRNEDCKIVVVGTDLCVMSRAEAAELRVGISQALSLPICHVLLYMSHTHSTPALHHFM